MKQQDKNELCDVGPRLPVFWQIRFANPSDRVFVTVSYPTDGGWGRNRIDATRIFNPLLYLLSYPAI